MEERGGFEPPIRVTPYSGFRIRRLQPLSHLSVPTCGARLAFSQTLAAEQPGISSQCSKIRSPASANITIERDLIQHAAENRMQQR